jgi:hypothetical protein
MQGFSSAAFAVTAFSVAAFAFDTVPIDPPTEDGWNPFSTQDAFVVPRYRLQIKDKRRSKKRRDNEVLFLSH